MRTLNATAAMVSCALIVATGCSSSNTAVPEPTRSTSTEPVATADGSATTTTAPAPFTLELDADSDTTTTTTPAPSADSDTTTTTTPAPFTLELDAGAVERGRTTMTNTIAGLAAQGVDLAYGDANLSDQELACVAVTDDGVRAFVDVLLECLDDDSFTTVIRAAATVADE